jgi:MFS family permease
MVAPAGGRPSPALRQMLVPLALAQFICSFAGSNMNVMIKDISEDLDTTVQGVQTAITLFLLVMAALMIPGGKLADKWGRKRCLMVGLVVYGAGALLSAVAPTLGVLIVGNSLLEGIGTALLIPPVYILTTMLFRDVTSRARAFGAINGMAGVGAATGPLIGGLITTAISWRAAFLFQVVVVGAIAVLARRIEDPLPAEPERPFDVTGAVLSAVGLVLLVAGILAVDDNAALAVVLVGAGAVVLAGFFALMRAGERAGREVLLPTKLFHNRVSNLGLVTQNVQWLVMMGVSFVVSAYLQVVRGYNAIETGVIFTAATVGILVASALAERMASRRSPRTLVAGGFVITVVGIAVLLALGGGSSQAIASAPGLFLLGFGMGSMLTPSVNVVQSSFPEELQGEISGLSRSVSNLGSSLGTAVAGTVLVAGLGSGDHSYAAALVVLGGLGLVGLAAAVFLPGRVPTRPDGSADVKPAAV